MEVENEMQEIVARWNASDLSAQDKRLKIEEEIFGKFSGLAPEIHVDDDGTIWVDIDDPDPEPQRITHHATGIAIQLKELQKLLPMSPKQDPIAHKVDFGSLEDITRV